MELFEEKKALHHLIPIKSQTKRNWSHHNSFPQMQKKRASIIRQWIRWRITCSRYHHKFFSQKKIKFMNFFLCCGRENEWKSFVHAIHKFFFIFFFSMMNFYATQEKKLRNKMKSLSIALWRRRRRKARMWHRYQLVPKSKVSLLK